jgi:dTDP-4-dehydrorhamnose 3,5-epimerase
MEVIPTAIPEVLILKPRVIADERGFFMETYQAQEFARAGIPAAFVQDNHSRSRQYALRGMHYQVDYIQGKLVRVVSGEIFDAVVDLRRSSPSFGRWVGVTLTDTDKNQLWAPPGFAHGFYVLSEWADVLYKTTDFYHQPSERCIRWDDPDVGIDWPIVPGTVPVLSPKDQAGRSFREAEVFA